MPYIDNDDHHVIYLEDEDYDWLLDQVYDDLGDMDLSSTLNVDMDYFSTCLMEEK